MAEYQNQTGETVVVRKEKRKIGYEFVYLKDKETIELKNPKTAQRYGLTPLVDTSDDETLAGAPEDYSKELLSIKGVGDSTAAKIISEYPTKKDLIVALEGGEELDLPEAIVDSLKQEFVE